MSASALRFAPESPFPEEERLTMRRVYEALERSAHADAAEMRGAMARQVQRIEGVAAALAQFPGVFREARLGARKRDLDTMVELYASATDADVDMFLPTRAMLGRALLFARLNAWRLLDYAVADALAEGEGARPALSREVDRWLHRCVYAVLTEEVLTAISMDAGLEHRVRREAVRHLVSIWDGAPSDAVRAFFPLLEAVWNARRQLRVNVGTLLGFSEMMMLLQAGCDPQFVQYFAQARRTRDEAEAFREFLVGVSTEEILSLEQLLQASGRTSMTREEAARALGKGGPERGGRHPGVRAYLTHRERYLQAAARRLRQLPGPKHTAEEYVMIYFLEREARRMPPSAPAG
jgi:hypothetical protein